MSYSERLFLTELFNAAVSAADPKMALSRFLPVKPKGRTVVIGAGKGAAQLASAFEELWDGPLSGVVVTRYGFAAPCQHIEVLEASHPVPDAAGLAASAALFEAVGGLGPDDLVVALICGGGSSLLPAPVAGLSLSDEIALNRALLASGAPISAMNVIRKQISQIKGGQLARAAAPAKVVSLIVSDVPGDDPAQVASGPTVGDASGPADALAAIRTYDIELPPNIQNFINNLSDLLSIDLIDEVRICSSHSTDLSLLKSLQSTKLVVLNYHSYGQVHQRAFAYASLPIFSK